MVFSTQVSTTPSTEDEMVPAATTSLWTAPRKMPTTKDREELRPDNNVLRLILTEIEVQKLYALDMGTDTFKATVWFEFVVRGGAHDPNLSKSGSCFPIDEVTKKPTFKPSLGWYAAQIDVRNALEFRIIDSKVMARGDDLALAVRVEGTFTEVFEMDDYPFDTQGLTMTINFNCRFHGPMPIHIVVDKATVNTTMTAISLCPPSREWSLMPEVHARAHLVGSGDRVFPGVSFTARADRSAFYAMLYMTLPMGIFSLLSVLTGSNLRIHNLEHRVHLSLILVLTVATYRVAVARSMPAINYVTLLDCYILLNNFIVVIVAISARVHHIRFTIDPDDFAATTDVYDLVSMWVINGVWLLTQLRYAWAFFRLSQQRRIIDDNLKDPDSLIMDEASVPALRHPMPPAILMANKALQNWVLRARTRTRRSSTTRTSAKTPASV